MCEAALSTTPTRRVQSKFSFLCIYLTMLNEARPTGLAFMKSRMPIYFWVDWLFTLSWMSNQTTSGWLHEAKTSLFNENPGSGILFI